ncbi:hypothetical protein FHW20_002185 [Ochrobactrum intermedium]|uniref:Restriction alleviation protein, Lar family n=1 Tax=Brucella intermedia TaxID=94625 RepID=A0ABR6AP77_9HYPH|nr:hypothetical protein [Brucella intermedia]MBA8851250.1 hypothetical protein [Brucella intermedia]
MASELLPCPFCGGTDLSSGGDDKFVGYFCKTCQATGPNHYGSRDWNTRPAPAATDTGLKTIGFVPPMFVEGKGADYNDIFRSVSIAENYTALVTRSQAVELLAGRDTVIEMQADSIDKLERKVRHWQERDEKAEELLAAKEAERAEQWRLRREMEADRDTQKAIATSLETELAAEQAEKEKIAAAVKKLEAAWRDHSQKVATLEAKLAAAEKALAEADEALQADAIASAHAAIRAVLGGKP